MMIYHSFNLHSLLDNVSMPHKRKTFIRNIISGYNSNIGFYRNNKYALLDFFLLFLNTLVIFTSI
jgi:hypothetical protein